MPDLPFEPAIPCENCGSPAAPTRYCAQCSFPIGGTDDEKTSFRLMVSSRKRFLEVAHDKTKSARIVIYVLAGIFFLFGLVMGFAMDDFETMIVNLFLSVIFLILAAWSTRNPFSAILTAFIIYLTILVGNVFLDPSTLLHGIIIKIVVIAVLIKGIRSASEAQKYIKELEKLKAVPVDGQ